MAKDDPRSTETKTGDGADKYRIETTGRNGQKIIQDFGRDRSDEEGLTAASMEPANWGGSSTDLSHTIVGGKANMSDDG